MDPVDTEFRSWALPSIPGAIDIRDGAAGRRRQRLTLAAQVKDLAGNPIGDPLADGPVVELPGPGDVSVLMPVSIRRVWPPDGCGDADGEYCTYADVVAADLPWRYTVPADGEIRPWLALVAGAEGTEVGIDASGRAWISGALTKKLPPTLAAHWSHVHYHLDPGGRRFEAARILCLRALPDTADCLAVVVPLYQPNGNAWWTATSSAYGIPVVHAWRFRTNESGTFRSLVEALKPGPIPDRLGLATLTTSVTGQPAAAWAFGLLAPIGANDPGAWTDPSVPAAVADHVGPVPQPAGAAPVIGPPGYGRTWITEIDTTAWGRSLNHDPRHRAVAALGTQAGIDWQQHIVDAASTRLGQTHLAAALLNDLTCGVELSTRLLRRRPGGAPHPGVGPEPPLDSDVAAERLAFYGPALRKVRATGDVSALARLTRQNSPLDPAALSAAALRLLRPGGALARSLDAAAGPWSPGVALQYLNTCPAAPVPALPLSSGDDSPADDGHWAGYLNTYLEQTPGSNEVDEGWRRATGFGLGEISVSEPDCTPISITDVVAALDPAFDPRGVSVQAVLDRISPRPPRHDVPFVVAPDLDLPAWAWLRDHAPQWLLPGADLIAPNSVIALRTNSAFVDAFLVGLSQQAVAELRWRGVPCAPTAMPMRTLWQRVRDPADTTVHPDLREVRDWDNTSDLGAPSHQGRKSDMLVIVVRSDLLRRYPGTIIRLVPRLPGNDKPDLSGSGLKPAAVGRISADLWFLAFDTDPAHLGQWFLILEETVDGPRFWPPITFSGKRYVVRPKPPQPPVLIANNSAQYAHHAWVRPLRAAIDCRTLHYPAPVYPSPGIGG
ncbi:hypothetical protein ACWEQA_23615 [Nocardia sp. NPDC004085]